MESIFCGAGARFFGALHRKINVNHLFVSLLEMVCGCGALCKYYSLRSGKVWPFQVQDFVPYGVNSSGAFHREINVGHLLVSLLEMVCVYSALYRYYSLKSKFSWGMPSLFIVRLLQVPERFPRMDSKRLCKKPEF